MKKFQMILLVLLIGIGLFLRLYKVTIDPPGLYLDEASIGVNAYDVLTTGKDEHGVTHPLFFEAYGEFKMPVYIYLVSAAMKFVGKNELAVRLPSILFGTATIGILFLLFKQVLTQSIKNKKAIFSLSFIGGLLLAISPWHLQFSRAGFEASVALFFYTFSLLSYLYFLQNKKLRWMYLSTLSLLVTFYTYDGYRLLVPITFIAMCWYSFSRIHKNYLLKNILLFCIGSLPLVLFTLTQNGLMRLSQTSAFNDYHNSIWVYQLLGDGIIYLKNYLSFFSLTFFFTVGDQINRHQVPYFGVMYIWQLPFILLGIQYILQQKKSLLQLGLVFLIFAIPLAPALAAPSPHSLRSLAGIIPLTFLTVVGIYQLFVLLKNKKKLLFAIFSVTILFAISEFGYYLDYYYIHYPNDGLMDWGGSCKKVAYEVEKMQNTFQTMYIDSRLLCTYDYFAFYSPKIPLQFIHFSSLPKTISKNVLYIKPPNQELPKGNLILNVYLPNQNHDVFAQFWQL